MKLAQVGSIANKANAADAKSRAADCSVSEMMIKETYRKRLLVIGILLAAVIPVGGMLAPFAYMAWSIVSGSATHESLVGTIQRIEELHWLIQASGIIGTILLLALLVDHLKKRKRASLTST